MRIGQALHPAALMAAAFIPSLVSGTPSGPCLRLHLSAIRRRSVSFGNSGGNRLMLNSRWRGRSGVDVGVTRRREKRHERAVVNKNRSDLTVDDQGPGGVQHAKIQMK